MKKQSIFHHLCLNYHLYRWSTCDCSRSHSICCYTSSWFVQIDKRSERARNGPAARAQFEMCWKINQGKIVLLDKAAGRPARRRQALQRRVRNWRRTIIKQMSKREESRQRRTKKVRIFSLAILQFQSRARCKIHTCQNWMIHNNNIIYIYYILDFSVSGSS